jgi:ectoine hydroxylase-related dioxygenase (phytanoyl-CoA dioxygenase family)
MKFNDDGFEVVASKIDLKEKNVLCSALFEEGRPGVRCLLDDPSVRDIVAKLRDRLCSIGVLSSAARAIQAITFDKTPLSNWKVTWHQDLMFPFARPVTSAGFDLPSKKKGVDYARPPRQVLEEMLAVRLHLDDCDETNGPLRVSPKSHRHGILRSTEIPYFITKHGETVCLAEEGDILLMKPLLLHASSVATAPKHRRVLHIVFHSGNPISEPWHRSV